MSYRTFDPRFMVSLGAPLSGAPLVGFASWNSERVLSEIARAWEEQRPILLMNPAAVALPEVRSFLEEAGLRFDAAHDVWIARHDAPVLADLPSGFVALLMTSGTTGRPRLVALDEQSIRFNCETLTRHLDLGQGVDVVLGHVPVFHAFGLVLCFMQSLLGTAEYRFVPRFDREAFRAEAAALAARGKRVFLPLVPAMIPALGDFGVASLRGVSVIGGDRVLASHEEILAGSLPLIDHTVGYGLTEAGPVLSHTRRGDPVVASSVGRALPGVALRPTRDGTWEFRSEGQGVAVWSGCDGRWRPLRGVWTDTGDVLERATDGALRFVDRAAWRVKRRGETLYPGMIESAIAAAVPTAFGVAVVQQEGGRLVAVVEGTARDLACAIRAADGLPRVYRPDAFVLVPHLPRNAMGKVARPELARLALAAA